MIRLIREMAELGDGSFLDCVEEFCGWILGIGGAVMLPVLIGLMV